VAVPATVLQVGTAVVLSQLEVRAFGGWMGSRLGGALSGVLAGAMLVLVCSGWIVLIALEEISRTGFSPAFGTVVRALPSGWGLAAVEAAGRSQWPAAAGLLSASAAAGLLALVAWSRLLAAPVPERAVIRGPRRRARPGRRGSPASAVAGRELRAWRRDPARLSIVALAVSFALETVALPLAFDSELLLPWAGVTAVLIATATSANPYGHDGTALWTTLTTRARNARTSAGASWRGWPSSHRSARRSPSR